MSQTWKQNRLEVVKNDDAHLVTGATARCSITLLMGNIGWSNLSCRRSNHRLALFYLIINGLSPPYLGGFTTKQSWGPYKLCIMQAKLFDHANVQNINACQIVSTKYGK